MTTVDLQTEAEALRKVPMFAKLDASKLKLLAFTGELLTFEHEEILFSAGDPSDCAYVIIEGNMEVLVDTGDGQEVASVLRPNQLVGEMGVLTNAPRSATIRARGHVKSLRINGDMFLDLLASNPNMALDVMRQLSDKLALSHRQFESIQAELQRLRASSTPR